MRDRQATRYALLVTHHQSNFGKDHKMAAEIHMPRLGWSMEEGTFGEWLKRDGDMINAGDLVFTVEGDKATQEIEAFESGILRLPPNAPKPGDLVRVGTVLAYLVKPGEAAPFEQAAPAASVAATSSPAAPAAPTQPAADATPSAKRQTSKSKIPISPRARRVAKELGIDWSGLTGSGATGRFIERDVRAAAQAARESRVRITPIAQRMAQEAGLDLAALAQSKAGERIERADVEAALAARASAPSLPAASAVSEDSETIPVTRIRRLIAERMVESAQRTAAVTLTTEADATGLVALREEFKTALAARNRPVPSYNDLLLKLTAVALGQHPLLNATWQEDEILLHSAIHLGLAVDTADGLLVPVIRNVQDKSLRQISQESKTLIERAGARQLGPDELTGGTFTITNLGMHGIDAFTPIINLPQCAILGVGRIIKKPWVVGDAVVARHVVALSLTFDHRIVDGAPAARFLNTVREFVETPALWLAE
jgi:pyruvate dehydrogenase E2 component (dihydrolipoamide acetyltransferase)